MTISIKKYINSESRLLYKEMPQERQLFSEKGEIISLTKHSLKKFQQAIERFSIVDVMSALGEKTDIEGRKNFLRRNNEFRMKMNLILTSKNLPVIADSAENYEGTREQNEAFIEAFKGTKSEIAALKEELPTLQLAELTLDKITSPKQLDQISETEEGRVKLRELSINQEKFIVSKEYSLYKFFKIHHLYRGEQVWVNGKKAEFRDGREGKTYYFNNQPVRIYENDIISLQAPPSEPKIEQQVQDPSSKPQIRIEDKKPKGKIQNHKDPEKVSADRDLGISKQEEKRLASYKGYSVKRHRPEIVNRTFEGRLEDHEILLDDLLNNKQGENLSYYRKKILPHPDSKFYFIDIGPGIANIDPLKGGEGKPAITSQEMAEKFPDMPTILLDLPSEVDRFTGKNKEGYSISQNRRTELLGHQNIHIVSGDGLKSLKEQIENQDSNPYQERQRPLPEPHSTIVVRAASSIDIYCDWKDVKPALKRLAEDFKNQPVLLLFNKEILLKEEGSDKYIIIGKVSDRGFNHQNRELKRKGQPPYTFFNPQEMLLAANQ